MQFWKFLKEKRFKNLLATMGRGPPFGMALWAAGPRPTSQDFKNRAAGPRPSKLGRRLGPPAQRPAAHATLTIIALGEDG